MGAGVIVNQANQQSVADLDEEPDMVANHAVVAKRKAVTASRENQGVGLVEDDLIANCQDIVATNREITVINQRTVATKVDVRRNPRTR